MQDWREEKTARRLGKRLEWTASILYLFIYIWVLFASWRAPMRWEREYEKAMAALKLRKCRPGKSIDICSKRKRTPIKGQWQPRERENSGSMGMGSVGTSSGAGTNHGRSKFRQSKSVVFRVIEKQEKDQGERRVKLARLEAKPPRRSDGVASHHSSFRRVHGTSY
jgi:hypothetical protein